MCGYDPFENYDYLLDRQVADEMGFETVQELYEYMSERTDYGIERTDRQGTGIDDIRIQKRDQKSENVKKVVRRT